MDNYRTHKHPVVRAWLADNPRIHLHFTPIGGSWMNQVETWFSILQRRAIARGVFRSVPALVAAIGRFLTGWNKNSRPFSWIKPADVILTKATVYVFLSRCTRVFGELATLDLQMGIDDEAWMANGKLLYDQKPVQVVGRQVGRSARRRPVAAAASKTATEEQEELQLP